jgi:rod shape-determining protein MreB
VKFTQRFSSFFSCDLGIDLGTANTLVYAKGRGIVVNEPSIVAVDRATKRVVAVGRQAKDMIGRTPANIAAIEPLRDGVVANIELTEKMLHHFIRMARDHRPALSQRIIVGVPGETTEVERRAVKDAAYRAKASKVYLVREVIAAAVGSDLPINEPRATMVVDMGGGTTDIAVISLSGIVLGQEVRVAGKRFDEAIVQHIKRKHHLLVGERTAEQVKITIGSAHPIETPLSVEVRGRSVPEGMPRSVIVTDQEIREAIAPIVDVIVRSVLHALESVPPELSGDIVERGIILTGGGALLKNMDARLSLETGIPVTVVENPLHSVALGTGKMLGDFDLLNMLTWESTGWP